MEERLLWLCCRAELDPVRRQLLAEAVAAGPDWGRVVARATYHRLLGLLRHHLDGAGCANRVPPAAADAFARDGARGADARRCQLEALDECTRALDAAGVDHLLVKGPSLQGLYPPGVVRPSGDLDLLVHEEDAGAATAALGASGFALVTGAPAGLSPAQLVRYCQSFEQLRFRRADDTEVELHFRLHNYGLPTAAEGAWARAATWVGGDGNAADGRALPGVGLEDLFLYLVTHVNLHAFGRILWYYDVVEFYHAWGGAVDWDELARRARQLRLAVSFHETLRWIVELLHPEEVLDLEPALAGLRPSRRQAATFRWLWRRREVFDLGSWIRPFDAARFYLVGQAPLADKATYLRQVLAPPRTWLAAHLETAPRPGLLFAYLRKRRRERRDWDRITRRDELLGGA